VKLMDAVAVQLIISQRKLGCWILLFWLVCRFKISNREDTGQSPLDLYY
jgi:hypothetical protein